MAFDPKVFSKKVLNALYEANRFFNKCDRSHDGEVSSPWAKSVDIYRNPKLFVGNAAVAKNSSNRKKGSDGDTINVPFSPYVIPMKEELEERMAANGELLAKRAADVSLALEEKLDANAYAAAVSAIPAAQIFNTIGTDLSNKDLSQISKFFTKKRVPAANRYAIVHADLEDMFNDIDVVKAAQAQNRDLFEQGVTRIRGINYIVSADAPTSGGMAAITGIWSPAIAVVFKDMMKRKEAYDPETGDDDIDYLAYIGIKRLYDEGVCVIKSSVVPS